MSRDTLNPPPGANLDADAVCAQCGTVNPEATFICKVCGNNLRDQRAMRLHSEEVLESVGEPPAGRRWLAGVLTVIGALLVLFVAMNVNSIANFVVAGSTEFNGVDAMWIGPQRSVFEGLSKQAKDAAPTAETIAAAFDAAVPLEEGVEPPAMDGTYVIMPSGATAEAEPYGTAAIHQEETGEFAFSAVLADGTELRGWATQRSVGLLTAEAQRAAYLAARVYNPVYGYAQREDDGTFSVWGQLQDSESDLMPFTAYRLP